MGKKRSKESKTRRNAKKLQFAWFSVARTKQDERKAKIPQHRYIKRKPFFVSTICRCTLLIFFKSKDLQGASLINVYRGVFDLKLLKSLDTFIETNSEQFAKTVTDSRGKHSVFFLGSWTSRGN